MSHSIGAHLYWIAVLPLIAAGLAALLPRPRKNIAAALAIGAMAIGFVLSLVAFTASLEHGHSHGPFREVHKIAWMALGSDTLSLSWVLDPLTALMLVMVTFVGSLIFIFSVGYMSHDPNATRFFCFLSLFAAAMLGLVMANSLLLLFMCWEVVGLASFLLIGFWFHKPSAVAAARKAFLTTRIGDIGFFIGILWLYRDAGTLLFYDGGAGCLEPGITAKLSAHVVWAGLSASTLIGLLLFCGAMGKSGQLPLHVWLPDAMEGPTPVSALIHAATMVAAGVFLIARVHPLLVAGGVHGVSPSLTLIGWVGAITAIFAALVAVAQDDIKRILAYSTVSQLGYMFLGVAAGGPAVGMFHLITHAFFKALLFLGAGSVIHGCHDEQDIRRMGGLRRYMPITFATYAVGMLALAGVPIFFSGFWSKDEILHAAWDWKVSRGPFYIALCSAALTAFYMTRQVLLVFYGHYRGAAPAGSHHGHAAHGSHSASLPHESPAVMTVPLALLAVGAVLLGFLGTPAWPWFEAYLAGHTAHVEFDNLFFPKTLALMAGSTVVVACGIGFGWYLFGRVQRKTAEELDPIERALPEAHLWLKGRFFFDELYELSVIRWNRMLAVACDGLDRFVVGGAVRLVTWAFLGIAWVNRGFDEGVVNLGFDGVCRSILGSGRLSVAWESGQVQHYLRFLALGLVILVLTLVWGGGR